MNTSVKAHKDMLDVPIYYRSRNINRASISELKPIANFLKRMSQFIYCLRPLASFPLVDGWGKEGPSTLAILFTEDPTALQYWSEL